ncbi:MAG: hypothetical protein ACI4EN_10790 [Butyrivibrio sp.]
MCKGNRLKSFFKGEGFLYFQYSMWTFAGLGIEVLYAFVLEPLFYDHEMKEFTTTECIIHWTVTIITWLVISFLIVRSAEKKVHFKLKETEKKWTPVGIMAGCVLIGLMTAVNYAELGSIKIIHEFNKLGALKFIFQHLYYLAEAVLFTLIIIFGQHAFERWFHRKNIPYGGIVVGLTWGIVHWFTKGSVWIGLEGLIIGFLFGSVYCILGRDFKKTYIVLSLAFII